MTDGAVHQFSRRGVAANLARRCNIQIETDWGPRLGAARF